MSTQQRTTLSDLIDTFLKSREAQGLAANTIKNDGYILRGFLAIVGNIQMRSVAESHVDLYFERRLSEGVKPSTLNHIRAILGSFLEWARKRRYLGPNGNPMADRPAYRTPPKPKLLIPASDFPRLLDCAEHPRDRAVVALGLFLFLRRGEITSLRIRDLDLASGKVFAQIHKSARADEMPVCQELDQEMRRWLTWYSGHVEASLARDWYLVPAKRQAGGTPDPITGLLRGQASYLEAPLRPTGKMSEVHTAVKTALKKAGYALTDEKGEPTREGGHTLRRSGARALYDRFLDEGGHDRAIRVIQAMLHHKSIRTTEHYLGIELDEVRRNQLLQGQRMFAAPAANVLPLARQA